MKNSIKIDDLGGFYHPYFWTHPNGLWKNFPFKQPLSLTAFARDVNSIQQIFGILREWWKRPLIWVFPKIMGKKTQIIH